MTAPSLTPSGDGRWVISGTLDFAAVPDLWPKLEALIREQPRLTLSLSGVDQVNSAGLVMLVEARHRAQQHQCQLELIDVPPALRDLADMSQCDTLLASAPT